MLNDYLKLAVQQAAKGEMLKGVLLAGWRRCRDWHHLFGRRTRWHVLRLLGRNGIWSHPLPSRPLLLRPSEGSPRQTTAATPMNNFEGSATPQKSGPATSTSVRVSGTSPNSAAGSRSSLVSALTAIH